MKFYLCDAMMLVFGLGLTYFTFSERKPKRRNGGGLGRTLLERTANANSEKSES